VQALRAVAHLNGASLLCVAAADKALMTHYRSLLNQHVFGTEAKRSAETDVSKALVVPEGCDLAAKIGVPKGSRQSEYDSMGGEAQAKAWEAAVSEHYPAGADEAAAGGGGAAKKEKEGAEGGGKEGAEEDVFAEPLVDQMRAQKE
jgi:hypothetical protein